ncbi:NepR family anti-sigma factor [Rhodoligotrophos defluvii]|uniref:NepR family anti-sigma factor n=1 Tax=Rhodoligotrophos defluvii TaxID=2561934 RepID=UPI0010C99143|nr:NepR family anti-sigma factor [Rhodoligotrophos defluvii]
MGANVDPSTTLDRRGGEEGLPGVDKKIQERLGRQLKALYDDVVKQPIPDRLLSLIAQLEKQKNGPEEE